MPSSRSKGIRHGPNSSRRVLNALRRRFDGHPVISTDGRIMFEGMVAEFMVDRKRTSPLSYRVST